MGIAKEIFGIENQNIEIIDTSSFYNSGDIADAEYGMGYNRGWNDALLKIDAFELSEEAIVNIIFDEGLFISPEEEKKIAKAIKANANKIFVRRGK